MTFNAFIESYEGEDANILAVKGHYDTKTKGRVTLKSITSKYPQEGPHVWKAYEHALTHSHGTVST